MWNLPHGLAAFRAYEPASSGPSGANPRRSSLAAVEVEGWRGWALASTLPELAGVAPEPGAALLPAFDPFTVALCRHPAVLAPEYTSRVMRDQQTYCGVLLDDNNRKPIRRFYFNGAKRSLGLFDNPERREEKVVIQSLDDLYGLGERLKGAAALYLSGTLSSTANGKAQQPA